MLLQSFGTLGFLITLIVGAGCGILLSWFGFLGLGRQGKQMQEQLRATEEKLEHYQQDVHTHFSKTADLINQLTNTYHSLHEHLSIGAYTLGNHSLSNDAIRLRDLTFPQLGLTERKEEENSARQLDYTNIPLDNPDTTSNEESYA